MTRRRSRSARLRLSLQFSGTFFLLGTIVVVVIYLFASGGPTIRVSEAVPSQGGTVLLAPSPPGSASTAPRRS